MVALLCPVSMTEQTCHATEGGQWVWLNSLGWFRVGPRDPQLIIVHALSLLPLMPVGCEQVTSVTLASAWLLCQQKWPLSDRHDLRHTCLCLAWLGLASGACRDGLFGLWFQECVRSHVFECVCVCVCVHACVVVMCCLASDGWGSPCLVRYTSAEPVDTADKVPLYCRVC